VELAERLAISRFQVAKILDNAREAGVVTIEIRDPRAASGLADELAAGLEIPYVRIVDIPTDDDDEKAERLGIAVMDLLRELARPQMTIGISWSRALDRAARFLPDLPPCDLVQLAGALQGLGSGLLARMIAQVGQDPRVRTYPISAPLVVGAEATARDLTRLPEIAEALARADHLDLAVVAIGAWTEGQSTVWDKVSPADREAGTAAGAVAEISGRLVGADGRPASTRLDRRTISVRLEQLVAAGKVIAVARDVRRADAVLAAAKGKVVTHLVIDDGLATALARRLGLSTSE
jgi:DNA-binding transcriptional regulator LsrR (DeoR family)